MVITNEVLKNIPWQEKQIDFEDVLWRHEGNPIVQWNPTPKSIRIYNSSAIPWGQTIPMTLGYRGIQRVIC